MDIQHVRPNFGDDNQRVGAALSLRPRWRGKENGHEGQQQSLGPAHARLL